MDVGLPIFLILTSFFCISEGKTRGKYSCLTDGIDMFKRQNLELHNAFRRLHGTSELIYKDYLHKIAQDYADNLAAEDSEKLKHSKNGYGENLMWSSSCEIDGYRGVQLWYDEVSMYENYSKNQPDDTHSVGHFTQVVWRSTCFMGIGVSEARSGRVYVVVNYDPPGNVQGKYKFNVLPPGGRNKSSLTNYEYLVSQPVCHDEDIHTYSRKLLQCHNILRKMHGVPPLTLDKKLNKEAQSYVNVLAGLEQASPVYGDVSITAIINTKSYFMNGYTFCLYAYSDERSYGKNNDNLLTKALARDYTQMIWKSTRSIGCGIVQKNNELFMSIAYSPPGNTGDFRENVFPQKVDYIPGESDFQGSNHSTIPSVDDNEVENDYIPKFKTYNVSTKSPDTLNSKVSFIRPNNLLPAICILIYKLFCLNS